MVAAVGLAGREESVPPAAAAPAETEPAAAPPAAAPDAPVALAITRLRVGAPPFAWEGHGEGSRLATFVTDSDRRLSVVAWARVQGVPAEAIRWEVTPPAGFSLPAGPLPTGPVLRVTLARPDGNPKGGGGPLAIRVRASVARDGRIWEARESVTQDERDQMRQEYVDLRRESVPERYRFLDAAQYAERYGRRFPQIRFEELNWSVNPDTGERYRYVIVAERLLEGLARTRARYERPLIFNSGYRNPTRQVEVHAPVKESLHQYGLAADLAVLPTQPASPEGETPSSAADWLAFAQAATLAGASWVEPISESGGHLHVDFREGGQRSGPVTLQGKVLDTATGEPVAGAQLLLAGMPATTDAEGRFTLRHVLTPRDRNLAVTAEGYQPLSQAVPIRIGGNRVDLKLTSAPRPRLTARAGASAWKDEEAGLAVTEIRVRNTGTRAALDLVLAAAAPEGAPAPVAIAPARLASLLPGAETTVRVTCKIPADAKAPSSKIVLNVAGSDPEGVPRPQRLVTFWTRPAQSPRPEGMARPPRPAHAAVGAAALGATAVGATAVVRRRAAKTTAPPTEPALRPIVSSPAPVIEPAPLVIPPLETPDAGLPATEEATSD
jgi:hypothetical protein